MLHAHVEAVPAAITVSCAILGMTLVVTRDGWLSLFMAAVVVPDTTLLPLLCIVMLPAAAFGREADDDSRDETTRRGCFSSRARVTARRKSGISILGSMTSTSVSLSEPILSAIASSSSSVRVTRQHRKEHWGEGSRQAVPVPQRNIVITLLRTVNRSFNRITLVIKQQDQRVLFIA